MLYNLRLITLWYFDSIGRKHGWKVSDDCVGMR